MLENIYNDTWADMGISSSQPISSALFIDKLGEMVLRYATEGKIDSRKTLALVIKYHERETVAILGCTTIFLMEKWGIIKGGPRIS